MSDKNNKEGSNKKEPITYINEDLKSELISKISELKHSKISDFEYFKRRVLSAAKIPFNNDENNLDFTYKNLLEDIVTNGYNKGDRTGTGTISLFGKQIKHDMSEGFPLLTSKKMFWKGIVTELLWFLRGDTNIQYLVKNGCHIWDGDAYKNYEKNTPDEYSVTSDLDSMAGSMIWRGKIDPVRKTPILERLTKSEFISEIKNNNDFAKEWGDLGPIYGKQWRSWTGIGKDRTYQIDQLQEAINRLIKNPDDRRIMVNAWNPSDIDSAVLPPCHYGFQFYTRELMISERMDYWFKNRKPNRDVCDSIDELSEIEQHKHFDSIGVPGREISLSWNQRSVDTPLGLPFNIASYGLLLSIIAKVTNMIPGQLIGNLGDTHIYRNQLDGVNEQIKRASHKLPDLKISDSLNIKANINDWIFNAKPEDFSIINYKSEDKIEFPLSN